MCVLACNAVLLIGDNAMLFNPPDHPYHKLAFEYQTAVRRLADKRRAEVDELHCVTCLMRLQLAKNISVLRPSRVSELFDELSAVCSDAIDGNDIIVDALEKRSFVRIDIAVRRWNVQDSELDDSDMDRESDEDDEEDEHDCATRSHASAFTT